MPPVRRREAESGHRSVSTGIGPKRPTRASGNCDQKVSRRNRRECFTHNTRHALAVAGAPVQRNNPQATSPLLLRIDGSDVAGAVDFCFPHRIPVVGHLLRANDYGSLGMDRALGLAQDHASDAAAMRRLRCRRWTRQPSSSSAMKAITRSARHGWSPSGDGADERIHAKATAGKIC